MEEEIYYGEKSKEGKESKSIENKRRWKCMKNEENCKGRERKERRHIQ